jgi:hypothetical protein
MLRKISIGLAFIILIICIKLYGEFSGFETGYNLAYEHFAKLMPKDYPKFSGGSETIYSFFIGRYLIITFTLLFYIGGKFIKSERIRQAICISSLGIINYQFWKIYN